MAQSLNHEISSTISHLGSMARLSVLGLDRSRVMVWWTTPGSDYLKPNEGFWDCTNNSIEAELQFMPHNVLLVKRSFPSILTSFSALLWLRTRFVSSYLNALSHREASPHREDASPRNPLYPLDGFTAEREAVALIAFKK